MPKSKPHSFSLLAGPVVSITAPDLTTETWTRPKSRTKLTPPHKIDYKPD